MTKKTNIKIHAAILSLAWLAIQMLIWKQFGIVTTYEAAKYIEQAEYLLQNGSYTTSNFLYYSTEIFLIALSKKIGAGYVYIVIVQLMINAFSTLLFYKAVDSLSGKSSTAFFFTFGLIGMFYYQLYNVHLFTESLYFSFSIIYFYLLLSVRELKPLPVLCLIIGLVVLFFTRPVGIFFLPATFIFVVLKFYPYKAWQVFLTVGSVFIILFFLLLNSSLGSGGEFDFLIPYEEEQIICGVATISSKHQLIVPREKNSVQGLFYIVANHWQFFFKLSFQRLLTFFGMLRSYYSFGHNLFICTYFYSLYILCIFGVRKWSKIQAPLLSFLLCLISLTALTTAFSCDEWHNRFIYAILPFIMLLATFAFSTSNQTFKKAIDE